MERVVKTIIGNPLDYPIVVEHVWASTGLHVLFLIELALLIVIAWPLISQLTWHAKKKQGTEVAHVSR